MPPDTDEFLTVEQLASRLKVKVTAVYRWNYEGTGPRRIKVGRHVRYRASDVDTWLAGREQS